MEDAEFIQRMKERIASAAGREIELEIDQEDKHRFTIDFSPSVPKVILGADVLAYSGLARMLSQYAILCLKERREVGEEEFLRYLRRN